MSNPADIPATRIYLPEITTDRRETRPDTPEIAPDNAEIGTDMQEIAGCSPETRISFMATASDSLEMVVKSREIGTHLRGNAIALMVMSE